MADEKRNWLGPYIPEGGFIRESLQQVKLAYSLMLDPRVPIVTKLIPVAALVYLLSPIDIAPDVIPGLGQIDDLAIVFLGLRTFLEFAPVGVVREHLRRIASAGHWSSEPEGPTDGDVIDGNFQEEK